MNNHVGTVALASAFILGVVGMLVDSKTSHSINTFDTPAIMHVVKNGEESTLWFDANEQHYTIPGYNTICRNNQRQALPLTDGQHVLLHMSEMESMIRHYHNIQTIQVNHSTYVCGQ